MDSSLYFRALAAFLFVIALIGLTAFVSRWLGMKYHLLPGKDGKKRRLSIEETLTLDAKRRLIIIKCDHSEHLILTHPNGDRVIAQNIHHNPPASPHA